MINNYILSPNSVIRKNEFIKLINGVKHSFSTDRQNKLPSENSFLNHLFFNSNHIALNEILELSQTTSDIYIKSICTRILAIHLLLNTLNENNGVDILKIWQLIYESFVPLSTKDIIASIGSQGFLSIPLFHQDKEHEPFEFLRLHVWDSSFEEHINKEKTDMFCIHSHQFHTKSWILAGEIYNTSYLVNETKEHTEHNLFDIKWNNSKNEVNRKTSVAVNTKINVLVEEAKFDKYHAGDTYQIKAGEFHKSRVNTNESISSTIFLFNSAKSRVPKSYVVGPSNISESEINRKVMIDAKPILNKLNSTILK